mgnify:CR=1 FL=1
MVLLYCIDLRSLLFFSFVYYNRYCPGTFLSSSGDILPNSECFERKCGWTINLNAFQDLPVNCQLFCGAGECRTDAQNLHGSVIIDTDSFTFEFDESFQGSEVHFYAASGPSGTGPGQYNLKATFDSPFKNFTITQEDQETIIRVGSPQRTLVLGPRRLK